MRRFLYFLPGVPGCNAGMLRDRGLLDRFEAPGGKLISHCITPIDDGPVGLGCIVAAGDQPPDRNPEMKWVDCDKFWIAIEGMPPCPGDLEREVGISGHEITLADGCVWRVPLIRRWDAEKFEHVPAVPTSLAPVMKNGKRRYVQKVPARFEAIDALADQIFADFVAEKGSTIDAVCDDAVKFLAVNYRMGPEEAGILELLDAECALRILQLAIDQPTFSAQAADLAMTGLTTPTAQPSEEDLDG